MEIFRELELFLVHKDQSTLTEPVLGEYKVYRITQFESNDSYYTINGLMDGKRLLLFWSNLTR